MTIAFENKLVAVLNKAIEPGKLMNALAHISFGLGTQITPTLARLSQYKDADNIIHPNVSEVPFIVLRANSNKIKKLKEQALEASIQHVDFTDTMTEGTYLDQLERTAKTPNADLNYYGIVLFGEWQKVSELTKKFSLWR